MAEKKTTKAEKTPAEEKKTAKAEKAPAKEVQKNYSTEGATGKRVAAICFWVLAVACELVAIMNLTGKWYLPEFISGLPDNKMLYLIIFLVLDLIFLIIGSQFWKKANHIDPASEKNKVMFFLQNQMGLIMSIICFVPFIVMLLKNDKDGTLQLSKKNKTIVLVVACVALLLGGLLSTDWDPISSEEKTAAIANHGTDTIYVTQYGHCYHYYKECQSLTRSNTIIQVDQADWYDTTMSQIESAIDNGYTKLCSFCANKAGETE